LELVKIIFVMFGRITGLSAWKHGMKGTREALLVITAEDLIFSHDDLIQRIRWISHFIGLDGVPNPAIAGSTRRFECARDA